MSEETPKVGVFICRCGRNIANTVDIEKTIEELKKNHDVSFVTENQYMCSSPGQELIKESIHSNDLNRVVVCACSRDMHEPTFQTAVKEAGLNPYLMEMANIREQCSWVHDKNKEEATIKAVRIIESTIEKVKADVPLTPSEIPVTQKALVIGGGIAGIQAALDIAESGYDVTLVEKSSSIGGHMAQLAETFPTLDCSQCILTPKMVAVSHHPKINLLTYSEVESVEGYVGNFQVKIKKHPRYVTDMCNGCDDCVPVCPVVVHDEYNVGLAPRKAIYIAFPQAVPAYYVVDPNTCLGIDPLICDKCAKACEQDAIDFDMTEEIIDDTFGTIIVATGYEPYPIENIGEYGYGMIPDVISGLEFERLLSANGPTSGVIRRPSDAKEPETVVFIHCAGSRDPAKHLPYCSKICCMYATKHALQFKHLNHDAVAINFYIDVRTAGKDYEEFYKRASEEERVIYVRGKVSELLQDGDKILVRGVNTIAGEGVELHADMVVLANGLLPSKGTQDISSILKISCDSKGFIKEAHPKLKPVETAIAGVYVAGTASGPKDIPETVSNASAAAAKATTILSHHTLERAPQIAEIEQTTCGVCMTCVHTCPYSAIYYDEGANKVFVRDALCEGCGSCASACPSGSIELKNSSYKSISNSIKALLKGEEVAQ